VTIRRIPAQYRREYIGYRWRDDAKHPSEAVPQSSDFRWVTMVSAAPRQNAKKLVQSPLVKLTAGLIAYYDRRKEETMPLDPRCAHHSSVVQSRTIRGQRTRHYVPTIKRILRTLEYDSRSVREYWKTTRELCADMPGLPYIRNVGCDRQWPAVKA